MKIAIRTLCLTAAVFSVTALVLPETLYAPPKVGGPHRARKPKISAQGLAKAAPGFEVGPDAMTNYQVDPASDRNEIVFISKTPAETFEGKTSKLTGHLELNPRHIESVAGNFSVLWSDLDTGRPKMNEHMMAAPWVNAKSHPKIEFSVKELEFPKTPAKPTKPDKEAGHTLKGKLVGTMSMNGKSKEIKVGVTLAYIEAGKSDSGEKIKEGIGVTGNFSVALADFDIKGSGQKVAKKQKIKVTLFLAKSDGTESKADEEKKDAKKDKKDEEAKES